MSREELMQETQRTRLRDEIIRFQYYNLRNIEGLELDEYLWEEKYNNLDEFRELCKLTGVDPWEKRKYNLLRGRRNLYTRVYISF